MRLREVIYCQSCYREDRRTPAAWAHPDPTNPKKADFYCIRCLTVEGIDIADCETLEAWRKVVADGAPPKPAAATENETCDCGRPKGHRGRHRGTGLSFIRNKKPKVIEKKTAYTEAKAPAPAKSNGNGHIDVGGFKARVVTLDEYKATGMREHLSDLDPIVAYVRTMKPGSVTLWDPPKGKSVKSFRERLGRAVQKVAKLPVRIEIRTKEKVVAVIREAQ